MNGRANGAEGLGEVRQQAQGAGTRLGRAVGELAGKAAHADVTGRARVRAADLMDRAGALTVQLEAGAGRARLVARQRLTRLGRNGPVEVSRAGAALERTAPRPTRAVVRFGVRHPGPALLLGSAALGAAVATGVVRRLHR
ncbi:DUF3618 domain-containing protein [Streptomyces galbus]|uniref:DUF3618 domain-containing protein n=1 Tax=Streptomyces galbus TaxID=33898 RepID=A0ABX1IRI9_STRGB|nr:DUF3618 domain-containing protein [Streptomyces galbus]NKQ27960.1 DUF3618 domain-containing protein [Streptomyces galbus]